MEVVRIAGSERHPIASAGPAPADRLPLVIVTWRDAWFAFDHDDGEEPRPDYLVTTVGFVIGDGPRFVSLAQEILPDGDGCRAVTHIPRAVIETVRPLVAESEPSSRDRDQALYSAGLDAAPASDDRRRDA